MLLAQLKQAQSCCYVWLLHASCFSRVGGNIFSWPVVKCVGTCLKIDLKKTKNKKKIGKIEATASKNCLPLLAPKIYF